MTMTWQRNPPARHFCRHASVPPTKTARTLERRARKFPSPALPSERFLLPNTIQNWKDSHHLITPWSRSPFTTSCRPVSSFPLPNPSRSPLPSPRHRPRSIGAPPACSTESPRRRQGRRRDVRGEARRPAGVGPLRQDHSAAQEAQLRPQRRTLQPALVAQKVYDSVYKVVTTSQIGKLAARGRHRDCLAPQLCIGDWLVFFITSFSSLLRFLHYPCCDWFC